MINLFDSYHQNSWDLHYSLLMAGFHHPTIVIEDDGFLPDDVLSPYQFFGEFEGEKGLPLYFNQVPKPEYWEISGTNQQAEIYNMHKKMGRIHYAEPAHKRLVKSVDWLDEAGHLIATDHYNQLGFRFAQTTYDLKGNRMLKTYFNRRGQEYLTEHQETGDLLLNWNGKTYFFQHKVDWLLFYLQEAGFELDRIFFNSLGLPFFVSHRLNKVGSDVLFWSEPLGDDLPGNMKILLQNTRRPTKVIVQNAAAYQRILELAPASQQKRFDFLGYNYYFRKKNQHRHSILILTNSDQVEKLAEIANACPEWEIHVGAITEMSSKLMDMGALGNVHLYPNISTQQVRTLFESCDVYLDINHGNEILQAVREAFQYNQVILGFETTLHKAEYVDRSHRFALDQVDQLIQALHRMAIDEEEFDKALERQYHWAHVESAAHYQEKLNA